MSMNDSDKPDVKKSGRRGTYPCYPLRRCLEVAEIILQLGGDRQPVPRGLIAQELRMAESSSTLAQILSAVRCFGFITAGGAVQLTPLAMEYFHPTAEDQPRMAILEAILRPRAFDFLIGRFDGNKMPSAEILGNVLKREAIVANDWINRVVSIFMSAIQGAGVVDDAGFLRYRATVQGMMNAPTPQEEPVTNVAQQPLPSSPEPTRDPKQRPETQSHTLFLDSDKSRQFSFTGPLEITQSEYERLCKWLAVTMIVKDAEKETMD